MSVYTEEGLPSPSEELKDVPFARISKTIMKPMEERGEEDISITSRRFSTMELNDPSSPSKGKKSEKSLKMSSIGKLNEKYAMMQQKMTHMAQETTYPRTTSSRNSKNLSKNINTTRQIRRDDDQSGMPNPFLVNSSDASNHTTGNLMSKWSVPNLDLSNLIKNTEQSRKMGRPCSKDEEHVIKWKNKNPPESFYNTSNISRSMTPNFHNRQERSNLQTTPKKTRWIQSAPRFNPSTPVHSQEPSFIVRKHAQRIAQTWPEIDDEDEDGFNILLASPSPNRILDKDIEFNKRYNQGSPTSNIYTRQLSQQNLSFADAARSPIFTDTTVESINGFFQSADELMDTLDF